MIKKIALSLSLGVGVLFASEQLNFVMTKNVGPLNPHLYSPNEMFAQNMLYEGLSKYDTNAEIKPHLAKGWEVQNDGKTYVFELRDDVSFTDGVKFNAVAVKANFDAILANRERHKWLESANLIQSVDVLSEYKVAINLSKPYAPLVKELSLIRPFRFVSPNSLINGDSKDGIKAPVGTGTYKLESSELGVKDTFVINENYWGEKAKIKKIVGKVIPHPNTKVIALKTGEADLIYQSEQIPLDVLADLKKSFNVEISEPINTLALAINSNKAPTSDLSVRKALNLAVDKDAIVKSVFFDTQKTASFLFAKSLPHCDINAKEYAYDIKMANEILTSDGWIKAKDGYRYKNGAKLSIELTYIGTNAMYKSIAEILQAQFKQIGVELNLKAEESSIFYKKQRTGDFGITYNRTWGIPYDPEIFLGSMRSPSHADYQAQLGLANKSKIDEKITEILATFDDDKKDKLIKEVLTELHDEAIYLPISHETNIAISSKKLDGVKALNLANDIEFNKMKLK
ncbi:Nickel-binding periplasmic protein [Campylobacter majalis]|uniref:Nickel-binding periplasmic protein n=1 Tax=Campylobacter majalis TaxID=2790656 RepID=A0ABM8Q5J2_9BACT|nr:nickel ABC transporter substrate-binding protein [Campylobacter majalis]CAD7288144.1 Nickel-binding periplasmic protein [Campylobacter majalis]